MSSKQMPVTGSCNAQTFHMTTHMQLCQQTQALHTLLIIARLEKYIP